MRLPERVGHSYSASFGGCARVSYGFWA